MPIIEICFAVCYNADGLTGIISWIGEMCYDIQWRDKLPYYGIGT